MLTVNRLHSRFDPFSILNQFYGGIDDAWPFRTVVSEAPLNLWVKDDAAIITIEVPGREPHDVQVSVHRDIVSIEVGPAAKESPDEATPVRTERNHPQVSRQVRLPFEVDADSVDATCERGTLRIQLQRLQSTLPSKITVKAG